MLCIFKYGTCSIFVPTPEFYKNGYCFTLGLVNCSALLQLVDEGTEEMVKLGFIDSTLGKTGRPLQNTELLSQLTVTKCFVTICSYLCSERQQDVQTVDPVSGDKRKVHLDEFEGVWLWDP